jgi:hypothetical protein
MTAMDDHHCEEQRDEAIQTASAGQVWIASLALAMTPERTVRNDGGWFRMHAMRKLPVVPICRRPLLLRRRANHNDPLARPAAARGALRDRHERWKRDAMDAMSHETNDDIADGEVVWSWRPKAGATLSYDDARQR